MAFALANKQWIELRESRSKDIAANWKIPSEMQSSR
jgi:hypothetical protein